MAKVMTVDVKALRGHPSHQLLESDKGVTVASLIPRTAVGGGRGESMGMTTLRAVQHQQGGAQEPRVAGIGTDDHPRRRWTTRSPTDLPGGA